MTIPRYDDELVTTARVQYLDLPKGVGRFALITIDNGVPVAPGMRPTTFGPAGLAALSEAADEVARAADGGDIVGVGLTGKPFMFSTGADLTLVPRVARREEALSVLRLGIETFRRFGELSVPSFAFISGVAVGGGLELALHCTYRTVSAGAPALGLPECSLGLVPAWGGAQLLPGLVGPDRAVSVIVEHPLNGRRMLTPAEAGDLGVCDAVLPGDDFLGASLRWAAEVLGGDIEVPRPEPERDEKAWQAAVERGRAHADAVVRGTAPAPYRALDLIGLARTASHEEGFAAATETAADLMMTAEMRASLYAFRLTQPGLHRPGAAPDPSTAREPAKAVVAGDGPDAARFAVLLARRLWIPVTLIGEDAPTAAHAEVNRLRTAGAISGEEADMYAGLISGASDAEMLADAEFVAEVAGDGVSRILPTSTAPCRVLVLTRDGTSIADAGLPRPDSVVGLRFGGATGVPDDPGLIEVIRAKDTDAAAFATAYAVAEKLGRACVPVQDSPDSILSRLLNRLQTEAGDAAENGAAPADGAPPGADLLLTLLDEAEEVRERVFGALALEVRTLLDEGVAAEPQDVDRCLLVGAGSPFHFGGLLPYLDRSGIAERATGRRFLPPAVAEPPPA